ncbi:MAG: hypothetical protein ACK6DP_07640 [Gemmatimonas sp.]|uniref:hypothetical protein n=1 Tax=Gemmatimonas sp. TaxID=1962908 RepID=UPI00391F1666|nr:hypothetical protein [Gemmatimonadota bacterium]
MLVVGGAAGYWLYGDRFPSVLSRAASGAADKVTDVAVRTSERLDSQEGARIAEEEAARRQAARIARDSALGWVTIRTGNANGRSPATRTANPLAPLRRRNGPAYVSLSAADAAGVLAPLLQQLPPSAGSADVAFDRDQLLVRAAVAWRDFTGESAFGALLGQSLLGTDTLLLAGPVEPVRPGLAQLRIRDLRIGGLDVPPRAMSSLVEALRRHAAVAPVELDLTGLAADALPVPLPSIVSDARVVNGKLTLYRAVPAASSTPAK